MGHKAHTPSGCFAGHKRRPQPSCPISLVFTPALDASHPGLQTPKLTFLLVLQFPTFQHFHPPCSPSGEAPQ